MSIKPIFETVDELKQDLDNVSVAQLKLEMQGEDLLLIDIREIQENVDLGTIPGAIHAPRGMLEFWADPASPYYRDYFTPEKRIVVFCASGGRSAFAARALTDMGFQNVGHLEVGFNGWAKAGEDVEETASRSRWMRKPKAERPAVWVGHISLRVAEIAASLEFFVNLGMRQLEQGDGIAILELRGGTHLILIQDADASSGDAGFDLMVEDVHACHAALAEAGSQPGSIEHSEFHESFYVVEPGGHRIAIYSSHVSDQPV